nr:hypothetical protein [Rhodospirillales bacterium]
RAPCAAAPAAAQGPAGAWVGSYVCAQGLTALDLTLDSPDGTTVTGIFHFATLPPHRAVPEGCFRVTGRFDKATGTVTLSPAGWLLRPAGFVTVGLSGAVSPDGTMLAGRVYGPWCDTFTVRRAAALPPRAAACTPRPDLVASAAH